MSRPNHASTPGRSRDLARIALVGSVLVNRLGQMAMSTKTVIRLVATQNSGLRRISRQASDARERSSLESPPSWGSMRPVSATAATSVMADPRVEQAVEQVHEQVDEQVDDDEDGHRPDDGGAVTRPDRVVDVATDPGDVEDALGDDGAAEQRAEVEADEGDDGDQRVAHGVQADGAAPGEALGHRGAHVVGPQVLGEVGAGQSGDVGQRQRAEHHGGQQQLVDRRVRRGDGDREQAQLDPEEVLRQTADDEDGDRDHDQGRHQDQVVEEPALLDAGQDSREDAEDRLEQDGHDRELRGDRVPQLELLGDLDAVVGLTQVSPGEVAEVLAVLHRQWVVEVVLLPERRGVLRRARAFSTLPGQGVAREGEDHGEDEERCAQDHRDHLQQPADDVSAHVTSLVLGPSLRWDGVVCSCTGTNLAHCAGAPNPPDPASVERFRPHTDVGLPAGADRPTSRGVNWWVQLPHFTEIDGMSIVPKAVIFTPVTLSDQPIWAFPYHIGMEAMSFARSASASWYLALAAAASVAAAASTRSLSNSGLE